MGRLQTDIQKVTISLFRYASLFFISCAEQDDNELLVLEIMHHYVEILDRYFGNVCELDIIYNYQKVFHITDLGLLYDR